MNTTFTEIAKIRKVNKSDILIEIILVCKINAINKNGIIKKNDAIKKVGTINKISIVKKNWTVNKTSTINKLVQLLIINIINKSGFNLLDVGCAYGPFLIESENNGYIPDGVEIISDAVEYVRSKLGFLVYQGTYESIKSDKKYDVITMWYVIEHFADLKLVLTKVNKQLKLGGIFAFATPNSSGISAFKDKHLFFKNSPADHISVWNPKISNKILTRFGFKIRRFRITGHHAERFLPFPLFKTKLWYSIFVIISRIFGLGDTFEVYAEKMKELND